jgi:hypothetical protein
MLRKYRLRKDTTHLGDGNRLAGTIVYKSAKYDYGMSSEDSRHFGHEFISVTGDPTGDYPFFTCPENILEEIKD